MTRPFAVLAACPLVLTLLLLSPAPVVAQGFAGIDDVDASGMSYHRFVRPGEATVELLMLGNAGATGVYVVGMDTDLPQLLALSGVTLGASSGSERSEVTVRIYRQQGAQREMVFEASVADVLTAPADVPTFRDGDIIYVETITRSVDWYRWIRTVSSAVSLAYIISRVISDLR